MFESFSDLSNIISQKITGIGDADKEKAYLSHFAPNIIQWVTGVDYWNVPTTFKFTRQYQILRDLFGLRCKNCNSQDAEAIDCWGKSRSYLESEVLLEWSDADNDFKCPKCGNTYQEYVEDGVIQPYNELLTIAGMRSGKSFLGAHIGGYIEHVLRVYAARGGRMAIPRLLHQEKAEFFEVTFAASTATQARDTIYAKYRGMRSNSPWIVRAVEWVKEQERLQIGDINRWEYKELDNVVNDEYLQVRFNRVSSNSGGIAGRTRIFSAIDELSRLSVSDSKMSAKELYRVLNQSLKTVRGAVRKYNLPPFFGLMVNVTSPISIDDEAMTMYAKAVKGELKRTFYWKGATWEFNPELTRDDFVEEYAKDPIGAERDFGSNPPMAATPYVDNPIRFWKSIDFNRKPTVKFRKTHITDKTGKKYVGAEVESVPYNWKDTHYIFCDAGHVFDSFSIVCAHPEIMSPEHFSRDKRPLIVNNDIVLPQEGSHISQIDCHPDSPMALARKEMQGENLGRLVTVIDWCYRIVPTREREIYFNSLLDIIKELKKKWKIATVAFDQWQSISSIQSIRDLGIQSNKVRLKSEDFMTFLQQIYNDQVSMLPPDPSDHTFMTEEGVLHMGMNEELMSAETVALVELLRLERSADLKKVIAPAKGSVRGRGSDDVARCIIGVNVLIKDSVVNRLDSGRRRELVKRLNASGAGFQPKIFRPGKI
jgi:hypothetical protein